MQLLEHTISAGCATKYSPVDLLHLNFPKSNSDKVIAGQDFNEDGFVVKHGQENIITSVDVLAPIVNDPYNFGRIAIANAISDIYAMGGTPVTAMNICCFPELSEFNKETLQGIIDGGFSVLKEQGIILAGGHTVTDTNIKYGAAVTGLAGNIIPTNSNLEVGDTLILTKPIGIGILVTETKLGNNCEDIITKYCSQLNNIQDIIQEYHIKAVTDVTGFGLAGHLIEMAIASDKTIILDKIPVLPKVDTSTETPNRTIQNYNAFKQYSNVQNWRYAFDPQTSGGLILAVNNKIKEICSKLEDRGYDLNIVGHVTTYDEYRLKE